MSAKLCYRDLAHPTFQETLTGHNYTTLKLVKTVAEFAQKVSLIHEQFASQILNVVESFKKKNQELKKERPVECPSTLNTAWETLLTETQYDAQSHADTATLLMKNVYTPLLEIASYKKSQSKKMYAFRQTFESTLNSAEDGVYKIHKSYVEAYQNYRSHCAGREHLEYLARYHNAHNQYVLQLHASNRQEAQFHDMVLPYLLEELEEIHIDLANTLNSAIQSHALLLLTKANEQSRRFEGILKVCKQVNPKYDIHNFVMSVSQDPVIYESKEYVFKIPSDPNIPGSEVAALKEQIVLDRNTDSFIKNKKISLQKEASELTIYLKQNQDVKQSLVNVCQRNLANHLYAKVYETQEDLCRKRNEIRLAHLQLAAIRAQIELLSPKQNGSASMTGGAGTTNSKPATGSIKGMWKKAFRRVKSKEGDTDGRERDRERNDRPSIRNNDSGMGERSDRTDRLDRGDRGDRSDRNERDRSDRMDRGDRNDRSDRLDRSNRMDRMDRGDRSDEKTDSSSRSSRGSSRQSSLKKVLKRRDSKEFTPPESEATTPVETIRDVDPVYSLLKCAADLPRQRQGVGHACCMRSAVASGAIPPGSLPSTYNSDNISARNSSRSSSPSSALGDPSTCLCPCHKPELLFNYHAQLINNNKSNKKT